MDRCRLTAKPATASSTPTPTAMAAAGCRVNRVSPDHSHERCSASAESARRLRSAALGLTPT